MTKEFIYARIKPYSPNTVEYIHHTTEGGNDFIQEEFQKKVPTSGKTIYDCGCGLGRLFPLLQEADVIIAAELDRQRFKHAVLKAKATAGKDAELDALLAQQKGDKYQALLDEIDKQEYHIGNIHLFNISMTEVEQIKEYGPFDIIISSHVFPHVTFDLVQGGLSAFYSLLKGEGILAIFTTKTKGELLEHIRVNIDEGHRSYQIGQKEFADAFKSAKGEVLPVRYYSFQLFKSII